MPVIEIKLWKGRTDEQKKKLIGKITDATVEAINCPVEAVHVIIEEQSKENWGIAGEQASVKFPE